MRMGLVSSPTPNKAGGKTVRDSRDAAVGSGDHPVLADERTPTEVEASLVLGKIEEGQWLPLGGTPECALMCPKCPSYLQGHLPGPGARDSILSIDDPGQTRQHRLDGRYPTAWGIVTVMV